VEGEDTHCDWITIEELRDQQDGTSQVLGPGTGQEGRKRPSTFWRQGTVGGFFRPLIPHWP